MDGRRAQWFAVDSMFFGSSLAQDMMARFGACGVTVWFAYLAACKRNLVPGQITVLNDADAMAQLGLSGMNLVNNDGEPFELSDFWRRLGELHTTARRRHGGASTIICRGWDEWQTSIRRDNDAKRKSRSRAKNARDIVVTDKDIDKRVTGTGTRHIPPVHDDGDPGPVEPGGEAYTPTTFEAFWNAYPDHARSDRAGTKRAWHAATARGVSDVDMLHALDAWLTHWRTVEPQYVPRPVNWLKRNQWETPPPAPALNKAEARTAATITVLSDFINEGEAS